jgi:transposase-like protein
MLEKRVLSLSDIRDQLLDSNAGLVSENKKLKQTKQMSEEMIAHKLKMREESVDAECAKRISEAETKAEKKIITEVGKTKDEYRDKLENQLEKRGDELKSMYTEVLTRLPDVSMAITKDIKEKTKA